MALTEAQKRAKKRYNAKESTKQMNNKKQKENFANIAATLPKPEKIYIDSIFKAHGLKPSEVIRGAAAALIDGEQIRTQSTPLNVPAEPTSNSTDAGTQTD